MASDVLNFPGWDFTPGRRRACVLGDLLQLTPADSSYSTLITYSVPTAPGGSVATIGGTGAFTPDVAGRYVLRVTSGTATANFEVFCFAVAAHSGLATVASGGTRSDEQRRSILQSITSEITSAQLTSINTGTWPTTLHLGRHGG